MLYNVSHTLLSVTFVSDNRILSFVNDFYINKIMKSMQQKNIDTELRNLIKKHYENPNHTMKTEYEQMVVRIQNEINDMGKLTKEVIFERITKAIESDQILLVGLSGLNVEIEHKCYWGKASKGFNPFILKNQYNDLILAWSCQKTEKLYQLLLHKSIITDREDFNQLTGIMTVSYGFDNQYIIFQDGLKDSFMNANIEAVQPEPNPYKYLYFHSLEMLLQMIGEIYLEKL